jgi:hypothetical protein
LLSWVAVALAKAELIASASAADASTSVSIPFLSLLPTIIPTPSFHLLLLLGLHVPLLEDTIDAKHTSYNLVF